MRKIKKIKCDQFKDNPDILDVNAYYDKITHNISFDFIVMMPDYREYITIPFDIVSILEIKPSSCRYEDQFNHRSMYVVNMSKDKANGKIRLLYNITLIDKNKDILLDTMGAVIVDKKELIDLWDRE